MCAVSMITDHFRKKWPETDLEDLGKVKITLAEFLEYQELKKKAEEYDKRTKQPDCVKPEVGAWEKEIIRVLKKKGLLHENK